MLTALGQADLSLRYAAYRARRRLRALATLADCAERKWNVSEPETVMTPPSLFLAEQPEKIRTLCDTTWDIERLRIGGGRMDRAAVVAYEFANAALVYGSILCKGGEKRIIPHDRGPKPTRLSPVTDFDEGALCGTYLGLLYFGHWLRDDSSLELLAAEHGEPVTPPPPADWIHCDEYRRILTLVSRPVAAARFRRLVVFDDEDFSTHKTARFRKLRERAAKTTNGGGSRKVFLTRGLRDSGPRWFNNESETADALAAEGFTILDPLKADVSEFARLISGADLVVGPEGSQLGHAALFLREGAGLLAITPPQRFTTSHKRWCDQLGVRYGFMVGDDGAEGFSASIGDLKRTIDLFN